MMNSKRLQGSNDFVKLPLSNKPIFFLFLILILMLLFIVGCTKQPSVKVISLEGTVEIAIAPNEGASPAYKQATTGMMLSQGDMLRTGSDGVVEVKIDDNSHFYLIENSHVTLKILNENGEETLTRLFLTSGAVAVNIDEGNSRLNLIQVESPVGVGAIKGSLMGVAYDRTTSTSSIACAVGPCYAWTIEEERQQNKGQESIIALLNNPTTMTSQKQVQVTEDGFGIVGPFIPGGSVVSAAIHGISQLRDAAGGTPMPCNCENGDYVCSSGIIYENYSECNTEPVCVCQGLDLFCDDDPGIPNAPECYDNCACNASDLKCEDGTNYLSYSSCINQNCVCFGTALLCTGVESDDPDHYYPVENFSLVCFEEIMECNCVDTTYVCVLDLNTDNNPCAMPQNNGVFSVGAAISCDMSAGIAIREIPNDPRCGGSTCECQSTTLVCSDGTTYPDFRDCVVTCKCESTTLVCSNGRKIENSTECVHEPDCGDGRCESGEDYKNCSRDCQPPEPVCGNGRCESGEDYTNCSRDCQPLEPVCGNGRCESGENNRNCSRDCDPPEPVCGNGKCESGEDSKSCPRDC